MKKYSRIILVALLLMEIIVSCKKSNTLPATSKDYTASIEDRNWWGMLTNAG